MKELTMEQKAVRYDEAIKKVNDYYEGKTKLYSDVDKTLGYLFPELKESEDERIKKDIIVTLHLYFGEPLDDEAKEMIDWVEKQGEKTPVDKIHLGKKYKCIASPRYSTFMIGEIYKPEDKFLCSLMNFCSDCFEPLEDGEQKQDVSEQINPSKYINDMGGNGCYLKNTAQKPAEWSKEDIVMKGEIINVLQKTGNYEKEINWLKSIKERVQPKQEWSEEDKKLIDETCNLINTLASGYGEKVTEPITFSGTQMIASIKNRLMALVDDRPQNRWKPSDEQIQALVYVFNHYIPNATDKIAWNALQTIELMLGQLLREE